MGACGLLLGDYCGAICFKSSKEALALAMFQRRRFLGRLETLPKQVFQGSSSLEDLKHGDDDHGDDDDDDDDDHHHHYHLSSYINMK